LKTKNNQKQLKKCINTINLAIHLQIRINQLIVLFNYDMNKVMYIADMKMKYHSIYYVINQVMYIVAMTMKYHSIYYVINQVMYIVALRMKYFSIYTHLLKVTKC